MAHGLDPTRPVDNVVYDVDRYSDLVNALEHAGVPYPRLEAVSVSTAVLAPGSNNTDVKPFFVNYLEGF